MGHVHLKVADLERALKFYHDALGFEVMQRHGTAGDRFVSAGGYHHHMGPTLGKMRAVNHAARHDGFRSLRDFVSDPRASQRDAVRRVLAAGRRTWTAPPTTA